MSRHDGGERNPNCRPPDEAAHGSSHGLNRCPRSDAGQVLSGPLSGFGDTAEKVCEQFQLGFVVGGAKLVHRRVHPQV